MKRKDYLKPTMRIVEMKHRSHILAESVQLTGVTSKRNGYSSATEEEWD